MSGNLLGLLIAVILFCGAIEMALVYLDKFRFPPPRRLIDIGGRDSRLRSDY